MGLMGLMLLLDGSSLTDEYAIEFHCDSPGCSLDDIANQFAQDHGVINKGPIGQLNVYLFVMDEVRRSLFDDNPMIKSIVRQDARPRIKREIIDPEFEHQWHLRGSGEHVHINVQDAWNQGFHGEGVNIAICDDGVETSHDDIKDNFNQEGSYNFNFDSSDVNPRSKQDNHGTPSAGCAAARDDGNKCGVGVAYRAKVSGIVLLQKQSVTDAQEARALQYKNDINHIYSNSWGPPDNGRNLIGPGPLTKRAMEESITNGREGKGSVYVWAAGNGGGNKDNCNYDGYASWRKAVAISAIGFDGVAPYYAENCSSVIAVSTSGTRGSGRESKITTSGIENNCNLRFSGTSAACPIGAGVVALMLQANPDLNWLDVQKILVETSNKVDLNHTDWVQNGAGKWVSHLYGFGLIDAAKAVNMSLELKGQEGMKENLIHYRVNVFEDFVNLVEYEFQVLETFEIHHVELVVDLTHPKSGDLFIMLESPSGTQSVLADFHPDANANIVQWTYTTKRCWGEHSVGKWKLVIREIEERGGHMKTFDLKMFGTPNPEIDTDKYKEIRIREGNKPPKAEVQPPNKPKKVFYSKTFFLCLLRRLTHFLFVGTLSHAEVGFIVAGSIAGLLVIALAVIMFIVTRVNSNNTIIATPIETI